MAFESGSGLGSHDDGDVRKGYWLGLGFVGFCRFGKLWVGFMCDVLVIARICLVFDRRCSAVDC